MRAVVDTNVMISGLLWRGPPHSLLEHARSGELAMVTSPVLIAELGEVLARPKFREILRRASVSIDGALAEVRQLAEIVEPPPLSSPASRDPDDDAVLALAIAARVDIVISGDADLLSLGAYAGIPISTASFALAKLRS